MHAKYAKEGLAAVSVSLDDARETDTKDKVLKFLQTKNAGFTNFILDESQEFWQEKFKAIAPPIVFVFNREGKWREFEGAEHYPEVEKLVIEFLNKK